MGRERLAQARAARGQVAGEQRMVLREAGRAAERLLEDRAAEALGQRDQRRPARVGVGARAGDDRGVLGAVEDARERLDGRRGRRPAERSSALRAE